MKNKSSLFSVEYDAAPKGISLTPNFSWVAAGLRRTFNRFNGFSPVQAHATLRIQAIGQTGKTAEAVRTSFRTPPTQLKLGVNERRTIPLKTARNLKNNSYKNKVAMVTGGTSGLG